MSNSEVSRDHDIRSHNHGHSKTDSNLKHTGTEYRAVKDGIGLLTGFKKVEVFRCVICLKDIEEVSSEIFPPGEC